VRHYVPLDVHTWADAWRILAGWLTVPIIAVLTGVLLYVYEVCACGQSVSAVSWHCGMHVLWCASLRPGGSMCAQMHIITVGDKDLRDLHFDQRINNWANK
jgi:hypothetical protein